MFTTGRKVDTFLWDHLTAMSYSLFRGYIALFIVTDFLTPNIHYSFSFKPHYSLFIIQLPPPKITPLICSFAKTFVVNFDPFVLFFDLANFSFIQLVVLSRFIFILSYILVNNPRPAILNGKLAMLL